MLQGWPAGAVHDTVQAILRDPAYRRPLTSTILERFLLWFGELLTRVFTAIRGIPGGRSIALGVAALLVAIVLVRLVVAAQARGVEGLSFGARRTGPRRDDPWAAADRLALLGDFEGAAHAMYRGVLTTLHREGGVRLDPSKTSGDYARELRLRGAAVYHPFRAFARRFDVAVYGKNVCDAAAYDDLRRLAEPLRGRSEVRAA